MQEYKTLNGVYQNIDSIQGKLQERLINDKENAYMSYELATIKRDIKELNLDYKDIENNKIDIEKVNKILDDLELKQIRNKINSYISENGTIKSKKEDKVKISDETKKTYKKNKSNETRNPLYKVDKTHTIILK